MAGLCSYKWSERERTNKEESAGSHRLEKQEAHIRAGQERMNAITYSHSHIMLDLAME